MPVHDSTCHYEDVGVLLLYTHAVQQYLRSIHEQKWSFGLQGGGYYHQGRDLLGKAQKFRDVIYLLRFLSRCLMLHVSLTPDDSFKEKG